MLAKRIIPCLDVKAGRVVKGVKFLNLRDAGDPVDAARFYDQEGADELVFLDITASAEERKIILDVVRRTAENIYIPFTVGGGVGNIEDIRNLLNAGADKVSINTAAVKNPQLIKESAFRFGSQCIVVAIDAKRSWPVGQLASWPDKKINVDKQINNRQTGKPDNRQTQKWEVYINGGRTPTGLDAVKWAKKAARLGAGEILLTSMDCDGTKNGYDLDLTRKITQAVNIPVIASGGAGKLGHFYQVFRQASADAALAASLFHYRELSIKQVKRYLRRRGVNVRL